MNAPFERCVACNQHIANPICSSCLAARMRVFVGEYDRVLAQSISAAIIPSVVQCILCNEAVGLCADCFCEDVYHYIKEQNPVLAQEFAGRFDFNLRRKLL